MININNRTEELYHVILSSMKPIWRLYKLYSYEAGNHYEAAHIVTIRKDKASSQVRRSMEDRARTLKMCLYDCLYDGEVLSYENKCFNIHGDGYCISFCLEGYKKHVDKRAFMASKDNPKSELLHHIGCSAAREALSSSFHTKAMKEYVGKLMVNDTFKIAYPNPADRMVAVANWMKNTNCVGATF